jgi:hypothetical protein
MHLSWADSVQQEQPQEQEEVDIRGGAMAASR